jgi:hypothetical protein
MRTIYDIDINRLVREVQQCHHEFDSMTVTGFWMSVQFDGNGMGREVRVHVWIPVDEK